MGKIYQGIEELVGHTPLVNFRRLAKAEGVNAEILAKLECFNPAGSAKDRVGLQMVLDAEKAGILKRGSVIIEPTSGNTGVGLAAVAAARGYKTVIVMPDSMSEERRMQLKAHGAELVLTDGKKGMQGAIEKAEELQKTTDNSWLAGQFTNPSNPDAHYHSTGPEIWEDTDGKVDIFVATVGTGGTITGTARYLKEMNPSVYVAWNPQAPWFFPGELRDRTAFRVSAPASYRKYSIREFTTKLLRQRKKTLTGSEKQRPVKRDF